IRAPVEWSEVAIVVPARVIPIEAECVEMTRRRFRERQTWIGRMQRIVDVQRLRRIRDARHSLTTLFEHFRNRYRTPESVFLELNGSRFYTQEFPYNASQDGGRTARLPARD